MNTLLEILIHLVFSAIIFSIIWYIVVLLIRRFSFNNVKPTSKSELPNKSKLQKEVEKETIRSNYKLLLMLKDEYIKRINEQIGLCMCIQYLRLDYKITVMEKIILKELLIINKPEKAELDEYWWSKKDIYSRIKFLNKLIEKYNDYTIP